MIAKFAKILRVTGVKTGVGVLIFDVNRSRIGVGFCNFGAGLESEIQKSDSGHLCTNYRPISMLSAASKVFEKLLYKRIEKFSSLNNTITERRFGFRQGYSTEMALIDFCSTLQKNRDEGCYTCCVFLDLSKAFDTINHKILLRKLQTYCIRGNMYEMLISHLNDRKQYIECNKSKSQLKTVLCGIPQGLTLGPLLFSLYINDLLCTHHPM